MALRLTVHERCERCGKRAAYLAGGVIKEWHDCPNGPPGPSVPPLTHRVGDVDFVRGDFTADELRSELDDAHAEIEALRHERALMRQQISDVRRAIT